MTTISHLSWSLSLSLVFCQVFPPHHSDQMSQRSQMSLYFGQVMSLHCLDQMSIWSQVSRIFRLQMYCKTKKMSIYFCWNLFVSGHIAPSWFGGFVMLHYDLSSLNDNFIHMLTLFRVGGGAQQAPPVMYLRIRVYINTYTRQFFFTIPHFD